MVSAISPGTEMLIYKGEAPSDLVADETIPNLNGDLTFPLRYGYACVGKVREVGSKDLEGWLDQIVFSFHPHQSLFNIDVSLVTPLTQAIPPERAAFLPNMETAISLLHDGAPHLGERVVVFGQGVVGLLTTALLHRCSLDLLMVVEPNDFRRTTALELGADIAIDRIDPGGNTSVQALRTSTPGGADLVYELTGTPEVLNDAIAIAGFDSRIVVGSWYGQRKARIDLGGRFHRERMRIVSSQVSMIAPSLQGRWTKTRRLKTAMKWLDEVTPERLITHSFPIEGAVDAYALIANQQEDVLQVMLTYENP
jgi:threonine dehydrogenase-like Zn-dependent dehydrogenase